MVRAEGQYSVEGMGNEVTKKVPAIYRDGNVVMDHSVDWPDGTRIEVCPVKQETPPNDNFKKEDLKALTCALDDSDSYGLDESLWPKTREGIELLLAHMDAAEPMDLTPEQQQTIEGIDRYRMNSCAKAGRKQRNCFDEILAGYWHRK